MNDLIQKLGVWVIGFLLAGNIFFIRGLVASIQDSGNAVVLLQEQMKELRPAMAGLIDLRIQVEILKTKFEQLSQSFENQKRRN